MRFCLANDRTRERNMIRQRWIAALILLMIVPLAIGFNARLSTLQRLHQDEARLKQTIADEQARQADLVALQNYVMSDAYVEQWARVNARMIKPGEVSVIPIASTLSPSDSVAPAPQQAPETIADEWWTLFFGPPRGGSAGASIP